MPDNQGTVIVVPTENGSMPMDHRMFWHMMEDFSDDEGNWVSQAEADEIIAEFMMMAEMEQAEEEAEAAAEQAQSIKHDQKELDI